MLGRRAPLLRGLQLHSVRAQGVVPEPRALAVLPPHSAKALGSAAASGRRCPPLDIKPPQHRGTDVGPRPCTACSGAPCSVYTVITTLSNPFITSGNLRHSAQVFHPPAHPAHTIPHSSVATGFPTAAKLNHAPCAHHHHPHGPAHGPAHGPGLPGHPDHPSPPDGHHSRRC